MWRRSTITFSERDKGKRTACRSYFVIYYLLYYIRNNPLIPVYSACLSFLSTHFLASSSLPHSLPPILATLFPCMYVSPQHVHQLKAWGGKDRVEEWHGLFILHLSIWAENIGEYFHQILYISNEDACHGKRMGESCSLSSLLSPTLHLLMSGLETSLFSLSQKLSRCFL